MSSAVLVFLHKALVWSNEEDKIQWKATLRHVRVYRNVSMEQFVYWREYGRKNYEYLRKSVRRFIKE